jgi:hypothetical protein
LHQQIKDVCTIAVNANADHTKFPDDWLFRHRWVNTTVFCPRFANSGQRIDVAAEGQGQGKKGKGGGRLNTKTCGDSVCNPYTLLVS